jgi:hypothetical protein
MGALRRTKPRQRVAQDPEQLLTPAAPAVHRVPYGIERFFELIDPNPRTRRRLKPHQLVQAASELTGHLKVLDTPEKPRSKGKFQNTDGCLHVRPFRLRDPMGGHHHH